MSALNGYFSDPDGDALTFTGASSNDGVATVSVDGTSAMVTGVARGSAVVTITAADPAGLLANQGFNVTVGGEDPATVVISRLLDENREAIGDPTNIAGTIYVLLDVQPNEETVTNIALTLNGEAVTPLCRGSSGDMGADIAGLAETGASVEVECQLKTNAVVGECMGMQLDPMYANGGYELSAYVETTRGDKREAFAGQSITLNNHGFVMVAHTPGAESEVGAHTNGLTFYGGPSVEGNVNMFHACPVAYDGTVVGKMTLSTMLTDTSQEAVEGPTVSFREVRNGPQFPAKESPFTWSASTIWWSGNTSVENDPGETETWIINSGQILNPDGGDITSTFRMGDETAKLGPLHFDFKAPVRTNTSEVVVATSNDATTWASTEATHYRDGSGGSTRRFRITEMSDMGVGHVYGMTSAIAVGDCGVGANADTRGSTAFVPLDEASGNVTTISQLPEEDPNRDGVADGGGYDCFVAEVQSLADRLGNAVGLANVPRIRTATTFGVDRTAPEISRERPSEPIVLSSNSLFFEVEEPRLETGEDGSGLASAVRAWAGSSSRTSSRVYWRGSAMADNGSVEIDIEPTAGSTFARERSHTVYADVADNAGNYTSTSFTFIRDQTDPALSLTAVPSNFGAISAASVSVTVGGTLSDATEIRRAFLSIHKGDTCAMGDDALPSTQVSGPVRRLDNGTNEIEFSEVFTVKPADDLGATTYCFYLHAEDDARDADDRAAENAYSAQVATFSVTWPGTPPPPVAPGPTFEFKNVDGTDIDETLDVTEGDATGVMYAVMLANTDADTVAITLTTSPGVTVSPTTVNFPNPNDATADTVLVTVTTAHDLDIMSNVGSVTHSATDFTAASLAVKSMDEDFEIMVSPAMISEDDDPTEVVVTVNAGEAADVTNAIELSLAAGANTVAGDIGSTSAATASVTVSAMSRTGADTVMVDAVDDAERDEENESIAVSITTPTIEASGAGIYAEPASIAIMDDDPDVTLELSRSSVDEDAGAVTVTITATADAPVNGITTFTLALGGTATAGTDYTGPASVTLTINTNGTTASEDVTLTITDDADDEANETIIFDDADGATVGAKTYTVGPATLTIMDNDDT
ncbi:hypothetical protein [Candidatus Palauibacter irciniicola]|uniref:hypothetical protein n=1 Tax=Candidatus Palauibacter irciniicola TaxID=3056733 RepID=UPI003B02C2EF